MSTCQITIAVCYNQYNIGNNLHTYLFKNSDLKNINQQLNKNSVGAVMSYQNILFHVQMCRTHKEDHFLSDVLTELSHKVTEYFDKEGN